MKITSKSNITENENQVQEQISWNSFSNMARCLSYNPIGNSTSGMNHSVSLSLVHYVSWYPIELQLSIFLNTTGFEFWMISVHERGHFVPGLSRLYGNDFICEPRRIGLSKRSYILELTQTTYLNNAVTPCLSSGEDYHPVSQCIQDYVMNREVLKYSERCSIKYTLSGSKPGEPQLIGLP